jgi:hypothetical protein
MSHLHLTKQALVCFRWPNSTPFSGHQLPKTRAYGPSPASPPCLPNEDPILPQDTLSLCAVISVMLAVKVARSNEKVSRAHLPTYMFLPQGADCHCSPGSPWAKATFSIPTEPTLCPIFCSIASTLPFLVSAPFCPQKLFCILLLQTMLPHPMDAARPHGTLAMGHVSKLMQY